MAKLTRDDSANFQLPTFGDKAGSEMAAPALLTCENLRTFHDRHDSCG